jgi:polysaccharide pyruvyl transferase WcaK-like protein
MSTAAAELIRQSLPETNSGHTTGRKFVLVDCYTGGNLGDGAIQDAAIANIRRRIPDAAIYGITLHPADTLERHGIPSYPIAGRGLSDYHLARQSSVEPKLGTGNPPAGREGVGRRLASYLGAGAIGVARALLPRGWPWTIRSEVSNVVGGFKFLKDVDILFISGGGQLQDVWGGPWGHPYAMLKWTVLARLRGAKPIFLSVGYCGLHSRLSRLFVRTALSLAAYRSYRDAGSRELMQRVGFRRHDPVFPDLAYSLPLEAYRLHRESRPGIRVVGVSPLCHHHPHHSPRKDRNPTAYEAHLRRLAAIVQWLVARGFRVSMFGSDTPDGIAIADLCDLLAVETSPTFMRAIERHQVSTVRGFLEHAAAVDVMVASRLHGVLLSQLVGTPVLALSYDRKVEVQMELVGQSDFCLEVDCLQMDEFQERFDRLEAHLEAARGQIKARFSEYRTQLEIQYDAILLSE